MVLLERGAFGASDTAITSAALGFLCLSIVPQAAIEIHSRGFYALGDTRTPVALAIASMLLNILLSALLVGPLELKGLALALSVSAIAEFVLLVLLLHRSLAGRLFSRAMSMSTLKTLLATAVMGQLVWLLVEILAQVEIARDSWITLALGVSGGAVVYLALSLIVRQAEAELMFLRLQTVISRALGRGASRTRGRL